MSCMQRVGLCACVAYYHPYHLHIVNAWPHHACSPFPAYHHGMFLRYIELPNKLKVLLIHDAETDKVCPTVSPMHMRVHSVLSAYT